nr:putative RNA-directed DNA polymerase, eukaryota, reverse transcriptase zinc-binding domain protein [Tanacetum cinerariifolium]
MKDRPYFARKGPEVSRGSFNSTNNKATRYKGYAKTFVNVVKDNRMEKELSSAIVLDDDCLNTKELNTSLLGRVLLEFDSIKTKDAFRSNVGVGSWFSALRQASNEFIVEDRIAWVEVEGFPFKFWTENTFNKIATKWGRLLDVDDQDESNFHSKRLCLRIQLCSNIFESFKVVFRGKVYWVRAKEVPGWISEFLEESEEDVFLDEGISNKMNDGGEVPNIDEVPKTDFKETDGLKVEHDENSIGQASKIANSDSIGPRRFKKSVAPCNGGSILSLMEEVVRLRGSMYTWCHKSATKMRKLDRFFVSENHLNTFPNINAITLERYLSDHRPTLLRESSRDYGSVPFRFFHYWIEVNGFDKLVMNSWYDAPSHGNNAILSFMSKLKFLKIRIKEWNVDYRRSSNGVVDKLKEEVLEIDAEIDNGNGNYDIVARRLVIINELQCISKSQVMEIAQKIKIRWCVEGDENNKFFYSMLNKKHSQSNIQGVLIDVEIDMNFPNTLSVDQKADLESMVTIEEVKRAVWECGSDKAPGPDGPISLIESVYKIIAKVLTNRLVGELGDIVNEVQSTFIANRQILDVPFIVNEAIQWCKKKKKQALIFKVDFKKAYDLVRWDYLDDVLDKFGFRIKWRGWIQNCLRSSRGSILINGSPTEEFQFFKGLKQGDPLSPFLFILIMESLHILFQCVVDAGLYTGIRLSSDVNLSHLFYADDAMFVGQWSDSNIRTLVHVLKCFH